MSRASDLLRISEGSTVDKILAMPVTKPAVKRDAIIKAFKAGKLSAPDIEQLKSQWEFTTPNVSFPIDDTGRGLK